MSQKALSLYKKVPFVSKSQTTSLIHNLESAYIEAVINQDKEALRYSLKGLIRCKHRLGIDASTYEKEYAYYNFETKPVIAPVHNQKPKQHQKPSQIKKPKTPNAVELFKNKTGFETPLPKANIFEKKLYIKDIKLKDGDINILFNRHLNFKDVLFFELNLYGSFKDIYDIKAILPKNIIRKISVKGIKRVQISQNSKEKVRLVLENSKDIKSSAYVKDNKLIIHIISTEKTTKPIKQKTHKVYQSNKYKKIKKYSKSIVIDAGHGGKDSGAVGYNRYQEKRVVLSVARKLRNILTKKGYRVYMTRSRDRFVDLKDRTHFANLKHADLFISIHANAIEGRKRLTQSGIETFYLSPARSARAKRVAAKENRASLTNMDTLSKNTLLNFLNREKILQSNKLAIDMQANILSSVKTKYSKVKDGGVRPAPFWVLVGAGMPSVLVEIGYITNPTEANRLVNPFYQKALAVGLANGIESYFLKN